MNNETLKVTDEKKLLSAIGLAANAGKVIAGVPLICTALKGGGKKASFLVIEACDTSENTHKRICDRCRFYGARHVRTGIDASALSRAVGKSAPLGAVALSDSSFCRLIEQYLRIDCKN